MLPASRITLGKLLWACALLPASWAAVAETSTQRPAFDGAPPGIGRFLDKAEAADRIMDPLARCLAFPDLPGNHWPAGLAEAHCKYVYGPRVTLSRVGELVDSGEFAKLDALFAADLERHFSDTNFSEVIHRDFDAFDASYESGRLTKRWLEKAPTSAYALDARAVFYRNMAESARGSKWISETPPENIARMHEFSDISIDLYQRALKVEPRLLPAYVGLMNVARLDSHAILSEGALLAAKRIDPACRSVSAAQMMGLEPRWGGSYPEMELLAEEIAPFVSRRPLLALNMFRPSVDKGERLYADDKYDEAVALLEPITLLTTDPTVFQQLANAMLLASGEHRWEALTDYVAASRFYEGDTYMNKERGRLLLFRADRPAWALHSLKRAVELDPNDPIAAYLLAQAYLASDAWPQVEAQYHIGPTPGDARRDALSATVVRLMHDKHPAEALDQVIILNTEFPQFAKGWLIRSWVLGVLGKPGGAEGMQRFNAIVANASPSPDATRHTP